MEWKPLVYRKFDGSVFDLSDRYMISDTGLLWNNFRQASRDGHIRPRTTANINQYKYHTLSIDGVTKNLRAHRAVASMFVEGYEVEYDVGHIDGDIYNNHYSNLRWMCKDKHRWNK